MGLSEPISAGSRLPCGTAAEGGGEGARLSPVAARA